MEKITYCLLFRFASTVKVKGIEIFGSRNNTQKWPSKMKVYVS